MTHSALLLLSALMLSPPSGRPPIKPLDRFEPRVYDMTFHVTLAAVSQRDATYQQVFNLEDTPIMMPVIFQSTFSRVDPDSLGGRLWLGTREVPIQGRTDDGFPFHTELAVIPIERFQGQALRWQLGYRVQVWSSRVLDESIMAQATWPREWPKEVQDGLKPQMYIESDNDIFAQEIAKIAGDQLRMVPPYYAAKDIVRHCLNMVRTRGNGQVAGQLGALHGLDVQGALRTAEDQLGSPHDLLCVCIAMLRAAGIPARAVVGIEEPAVEIKDIRDRRRPKTRFVSWGEFYLNGIGWVPFDPVAMSGKGIRNRNVRQPWPEFGTMEDLNRRIPLSFHFIPPATTQSPQAPAVWGWDPRPAPPSYGAEQTIQLSITSRGRGVDDDIE